MINRDVIQDVIDRILKYKEDYLKELKLLNKKFDIKLNTTTVLRKYKSVDKK